MKLSGIGVARAAVVAVVALVCGVPLAYVVLSLAEGPWDVHFDARLTGLLIRTLIVSAGASAIATALGVPLGLAIGDAGSVGRRVLAGAAAVPFLIPPWIFATTWIDLGGAKGLLAQAVHAVFGVDLAWSWLYTPGGAAWVLGAAHVTIPAAAVVIAIRRRSPSLEEAARLARGPIAAYWQCTVRRAWPMAATAALVVFLLALPDFAVPSLLQVNVFPVEAHTLFTAFHDVPGALRAVLPLIAVALVAVGLWWICVPKYRHSPGESSRVGSSLPLPLSLRVPLVAAGVAIVIVTAVLPLAALLWRMGSVRALGDAWASGRQELATSVVLAVATACIVAAVGFGVAAGIRDHRVAGLLGVAALACLVLSGPALGIALIEAWNHADWRAGVYDSLTIVVLACAARYLIAGLLVVGVGRRSLPEQWYEAARVAGVRWRRQLLYLSVPLLAPWLVGAWGLAFVLSFYEVDAGVLLTPPGYTTAPVRIFGLMHYGPSELVASMSLMVVATVGVVGGLTLGGTLLARRLFYGPLAHR